MHPQLHHQIPPFSQSTQTASPCPSNVWRSTRFPVAGRYEAGAESSPCSTKHSRNASCGCPENANRTSFTLANTSSNTDPAHSCNLDRRTGCGAVCARVSLNANSPTTRAPVSYLPDTATTITKRRLTDSVAPPCPSVPTSGARVNIISGGSEKFRRTLQILDSVQFAFWTTGPVKLVLSSARYTTALGAVHGSWCLRVYQGSSLVRDIARNVDKSRGAELDGAAETRPRTCSRFRFSHSSLL